MWNNFINKEKPIDEPIIYKINEKSFIKTQLYLKRGSTFYDITLNINDKEIFIGRFNKEFDSIKVNYKYGKILIYYDEYNSDKSCLVIKEVLALYDILDGVTYACTQIEALNIFDKDIDTSYLNNYDNKLIRTDVEKKKRYNIKKAL